MIVCIKCGTHNGDGEKWCRGCGAFLEWDGEKVVAATPPEGVPVIPTGVAQPRRGLVRRIKSAIGMEDKPNRGRPGRSG